MMYETPQNEAPGLEEYLRALRSRWWVVLAAVIVGFVIASIVAGARTPMYEAAAKVTVGPTPVGGAIGQAPDPATEADRLRSTAIATTVATKYGNGTDPNTLLDHLKVSYLSQRNVLDLVYTDKEPERARTLVNSFAVEYVTARETAAKTYYDNEVTKLNAELATINGQLAAIERSITEKVSARNDLQRLATQSQEQRDQLNILNTEIETLSSQRNQLSARALQLAGLISDAQRARDNRAPSAEVSRQSSLPTTPTGVSDSLLKLAGALVGLILGVVGAFTLARLDRSATDSSEVEEATAAPVLTLVPAFRLTKAKGVNALVMITNSRSLRLQRARESYRRLRTSLQVQLAKVGRSSVLVTSAHPSEGKSVTAANLAIAAAQAGKRTVLVSADLRRPSIERLLSVPNDKGLSDWLAEETEAVVQELPSIPNLSVIVAGNQLDGPGELLASPRFGTLVEDLEAEFDLVVLDTPPVLATADAATIVSSVGGVLLVVDGRRTDLTVLQRITGELTRAGGRIIGTVMNRTTAQPGQSMLRRDAYAYEREARKRLS